MVERKTIDPTVFLRYKFGNIYPEFRVHERAAFDPVSFQREVQNRVASSQDHIAVDDRKYHDRMNTPFHQYLSTAQRIALTAAGIPSPYVHVDSFERSQSYGLAKKKQSVLAAKVHDLLRPVHHTIQEASMMNIALKIIPYLQFAQLVYKQENDMKNEGIRYASQFDLAVSYLWGFNGDAKSKVMTAFETPDYLWLQSQHDFFLRNGLLS